jgi:hypothetical protein
MFVRAFSPTVPRRPLAVLSPPNRPVHVHLLHIKIFNSGMKFAGAFFTPVLDPRGTNQSI